jgi:hypothetical protein
MKPLVCLRCGFGEFVVPAEQVEEIKMKPLVCLRCGFGEFVVPAEQVEEIKNGDLPPQSQRSARAS